MAALCPTCSKNNPAEARFCYHDGVSLNREQHGRPLPAGSVPFPRPFVFPNGATCPDFNQLLLTCQSQWSVAQDLLAQGKWPTFFASFGRIDLADTARRAAQAPDFDRGLSQLLEQFPSEVRQPPKLAVEPGKIQLGQLSPGKDGSFDLLIKNDGMLLLAGVVVSTCNWLAFGEGAGQAQRLFQATRDCRITVRILGSKLRAATHPLDAELCIDTNGGCVTVPVRAEVPVRPFPRGVLAGAMLPRDLAKLAKAHPREAAPLFEQGAVKAWYESNGWTYPIVGQVGAGSGAVQQFFEALGLVKPPQVRIDNESLPFHGKSGEHLAGQVVISTQEKKPVYAHAASNQNWLTLGPPLLNGASATVPFKIVVPQRPGEKLQAAIAIRANGNQKFVVRVGVNVSAANAPTLSEHDAATLFETPVPKPVSPSKSPVPITKPIPPTIPAVTAPNNPGPLVDRRAKRPAPSRPGSSIVFRTLLRLPKPVLFGLCGACGGLASAVLLGLMIWLVLHPAPQQIEAKIRIAVPESMEVYRGAKNRFTIQMARDHWQGPIQLGVEGVPDGVSVQPMTVSDTETKAELEIVAGDAVPDGSHRLRIVASGTAGTLPEPAATVLQLNITRPPPALAIAVSPLVKMDQGDWNRFGFIVTRGHHEGDVTIRFKNTPPGVSLKPITIGADATETTGEARAAIDAPTGTQRVLVEAESIHQGKKIQAQTDFLMEVARLAPPKIDVVFVVDTTDSMDNAIKGIRNGITSFAQKLEYQQGGARIRTARVGLVDFRDISEPGNEDRPKALQFGGETLTQDYQSFQKQVGALKAAGGGLTYDESSLQGLVLAAKQPFHADAVKVVILITDAGARIHRDGDKFFKIGDIAVDSPPYSVDETVDILRKAGIDQLHIVAARKDYEGTAGFFGSPENVYKNFHKAHKDSALPGEFFDITDALKNSNVFAQLLPKLGTAISSLTTAAAASAATAESPAPPAPGSAAALARSPAVPGLPALLSTEKYAETDRFQLIVAVAVWTAAIAAGISLLILLGQLMYRRKGFLHIGDAAKAVTGGVLAGLIGGGVGQTLGGTSDAWDAVSKIIGWGLLGGLIGAGMALFVPNLRWQRGLLGGLLGGVLAATAFLLIAGLLGWLIVLALGETFGRYLAEALGQLVGATVLGFCIGMMVALAELIFRRQWLEVAFGKHEIRTFNLGRTPLTIGGDERRAVVYVEGSPPITLSYRWDGKRILCKDMVSARIEEVQPGDQRAVGRATVTVCSASQARKIGYALQLSNGKSVQLVQGLPLTAEELDGLDPRDSDGVVGLVSSHPRDPKKLLLRNRSRITWRVQGADASPRSVEPGGSVELALGVQVQFGKLHGVLAHDKIV